MEAGTKQAGEVPVAPDSVQALRELVLLRALDTLAFALPVVCLVIVVQSWMRNELDALTIATSSFGLSFPLLRFLLRPLGFRRAAIFLLAAIVIAVFLVAARGGVAVGNMSLAVLALTLGTLFFGRAGALLTFGAIAVAFAGGGALVLGGWVSPPSLTMWNPETLGFWLRQLVALVVIGLALVLTQVFIVESLIGLYNATQRLAQLEHEQRLALEAAEIEKERTQRALEESRRIEGLARLAGGIAHDFNNTLTIIMGTIEMASWNIHDRRYLEQAFKQIMTAAESSAELTRQLLMLGRQQISTPKVVAMAPTLQRLCAALTRIIPEDVALELDVSADALTFVDPLMLERAFYNLMLNARDAMPTGGRIRVECKPLTRDEGSGATQFVMLKVTDTGVGMNEQTLAHVFDPFFTTKGLQGTGLGLATVQAWVKAAGGEIIAESTVGKGSAFTLLLPAEGHSPEPDTTPLAPQRPAPAPGARSKVLVVENRSDLRSNMEELLQQGGYDVLTAASGDEAIVLLRQHEDLALICLDSVLSGMSAMEVIERIRRLRPQLAILLCSGSAPEDLLRRGMAAGTLPFLAKPFTGRQLLEQVGKLLQ